MSEPVDYGPCRCTTRPSVRGDGYYRVPGMLCRIPGHTYEEFNMGPMRSYFKFTIPPAPMDDDEPV